MLGIDGPRGEPELFVVRGFEGVEGGGVAQGEADVVEAVEQAIFAEWVDVDGKLLKTLHGDTIVAEFQQILDKYVESHYGQGA